MAGENQQHDFGEVVRRLKRKQPFDQFEIVLTGGERIMITDPEMMAIGETIIFYVVPRSGRTIRIRKSEIAAVYEMEYKTVWSKQ